MSESKNSVLITGANGFIGARLCHKFLSEGFRVIAGVRETSDLSALASLKVEYRYGDVTAPETLPAMVDGVDYVVHNAGVVKAKRRETFFLVNEVGTESLMAALAEHNPGVKRVVLMSSLAASGPSSPGKPVSETDDDHPVTTYGASKLAGEKAAMKYADRLNVIALRPSGVYGPGDKELFSLFETVHKGLRPHVGDMSRILQLVHVDDLCRAVFLGATAEVPSGEHYLIAENRGYTMKELIALLVTACDRKTITLRLPSWAFRCISCVSATPMLTREKAGELLASWEVATDKAKTGLGFESRIPFEQGARETYQWYLREGWL